MCEASRVAKQILDQSGFSVEYGGSEASDPQKISSASR